MASEEDLARVRAAAVQMAKEGNLKGAAGITAIGQQIEEDQKKDQAKKKK